MRASNVTSVGLLLLAAVACRSLPLPTATRQAPVAAPTVESLAAPEDFSGIQDAPTRSRALFVEASKVLTHARCLNCHPDSDTPSQGHPQKLHSPPVTRGDDGHGTFTLACSACHTDHNLDDQARVPGAPDWHLAPRSMAWQGLSLAALCAQLKDPSRNGRRNLSQIVSHVSADALVGWGWAPGADRAPAPGTQARFGALMAAWVSSGAECPTPGTTAR